MTSIVLQDGGWFGTVFNLVMLAMTLLLVGAVCRGLISVLVFLLGGVLANVLTLLIFNQSGAGTAMTSTGWPSRWVWSPERVCLASEG